MMRTTVSDAGATTEARGLAELYLRFAPSALRFAFFLTGDREVARDLVQDAFVRVAGRFAHLRSLGGFEAYLRRTIVNLHTSRLRRLRTERAYLERERGRAPAGPAETDPLERQRLWLALRELPPRQRAAVVLRYYEDLSEVEAAEVLGCSPGALNQLVVRAMATLRTTLGDEDPR
jgi:RNA polymerase sigma-70 factor (sigma-E family)